MKSIVEMKRELLLEGARVRLLELNQERGVLLKLLDTKEGKADSILKHLKEKRKYTKRKANKKGRKYKKGTHWMQKPENKARVKAMLKARWEK